MKIQKTIKLLSGLVLTGCFIITQQTVAQTWGGVNGDVYDVWVVNSDQSDHWSYLRLQTSNNRAWNMVNQGDLWWG